jgi:hypothetical protein
MKIATIILGILGFALATVILYCWGMVRQKKQPGDLMNLLFSKGETKVQKYLKTNDFITVAETEKLCKGMEAKLPFSGNRAVVKDTKDFALRLLNYMVKTGQLKKDGARYVKIK